MAMVDAGPEALTDRPLETDRKSSHTHAYIHTQNVHRLLKSLHLTPPLHDHVRIPEATKKSKTSE